MTIRLRHLILYDVQMNLLNFILRIFRSRVKSRSKKSIYMLLINFCNLYIYFTQFFQKNIPTNGAKLTFFQHPRFNTGIKKVVIQMEADNSVPPGTYVTGQVSRMHLLSGCILGCAFSVYLLPLAS